MSEIPIFIADAFVGALGSRVLRGNPAAVVLLDAPQEALWMQEVAAEINLSETAFVVQRDNQNFDLRWFTPLCEVALCGHATLASAHVLWENGRLPPEREARFHTLSGVLTARKRGDEVALDFPAQEVEACELPESLLAAFGLEGLRNVRAYRAADDWLLEMHEALVENAKPDFSVLRQISTDLKIRGVILSGPAEFDGLGFDFVSRFFAPSVGIDEDPVTGSAHTKLAPFWGARLDKTQMVGFQASKRGGLVSVNWQKERVELSGRAQTRLRGHWLI